MKKYLEDPSLEQAIIRDLARQSARAKMYNATVVASLLLGASSLCLLVRAVRMVWEADTR